VSTVFFITHPDVAIDPGVPVPDWPLNERGRARMYAITTQPAFGQEGWAAFSQAASAKRATRPKFWLTGLGSALQRYRGPRRKRPIGDRVSC
jgi:hypothetical protein